MMNKTENATWKDENVQLIVWIPNSLDEWLSETLQKLAKHKVKVSKSEFVRRSVLDKCYNLESFFALLELAEKKGGVTINGE